MLWWVAVLEERRSRHQGDLEARKKQKDAKECLADLWAKNYPDDNYDYYEKYYYYSIPYQYRPFHTIPYHTRL